MSTLFNEQYLVYRIRESNLFAAISDPYLRDIRQYAAEYQSLSEVPADRLVKACIFTAVNDHLFELQNNGTEVELPVNCLEFNTGSFRLSA